MTSATSLRERIVYRVLREPALERRRFESDQEKGRQATPEQIADPRLYTGISTFTPKRFAAQQARHLHLGSYLAELLVPPHVELEPTLRTGHYTLQGDAESRLAMVWAVHEVDSVLKEAQDDVRHSG